MDAPPAILDHLASLADTTRSRLLLLLDRHELTVSELCGITQLPQSTVSRHLKALVDGGWIASRAEGTSHLYTMTRDELDAVRAPAVAAGARAGRADAGRRRRISGGCRRALAERRTKSQEFFSSSAGQWDRLRDELFGDRFHLAAFAALADADWTVGDLGCGTGQVSAALAPFVARVIAVDASAAMLQAAKKRLHGFDNIDLRRGELEALPIDDGRLDAATLMLVLHHVPEPARALAEVARVLKPGGRVIIAGHAAARSRELSPADGPRLARVFRKSTCDRLLRRQRLRRDSHRSASARTRKRRARACSSQPARKRRKARRTSSSFS